MSARRLVSLLSLTVLTTASVAIAQPKKKAPPPPVAPAKDAAPAPGPGSGDAVQPIDDPPPSDMNGTDENPDAPKGTGVETDAKLAVVPEKKATAGYPMEEVLRPITLPQNMSEVSIAPHLQVSPFEGSVALRARYGITRQVQLGLTYMLGGVFPQPMGSANPAGATKFKPGKAVGLDVTVLLQDWIAIQLGVPIYIDPVAVAITLGAPMKFVFNDKFSLGALDDLLSVKVHKFAPTFYSEAENARRAYEINNTTGTSTSTGTLRFSGYGAYQQDQHLALVARLGFALDDFSGSKNTTGHGGTTVYIRGGIQYAVKRFLDLGVSIGWDSLANLKTFAPAGYLAVRI